VDPDFDLYAENGLEDEAPVVKIEETFHRVLEASFLNSCNILTDDQACCVGGSNKDYGANFEVDTGSCRTTSTNSNSCNLAGTLGGSVKIAKNSCNGYDTCYAAGYNEGSVEIKNSSCNGQQSCKNMGLGHPPVSGGNAVIGENSCNGDNSCSQAGLNAGNVWIGNNACNSSLGRESCTWMGKSGNATVFNNSCRGSYACSNSGYYGTFYVAEGSCGSGADGYAVCNGAGSGTYGDDPSLTSFRIGKGSCHGPRACQYAGTKGCDVIVADNTCNGDNACKYIGNLGLNGKVIVHKNSCNGDHTCSTIGQKNSGTVTIQSGSCIGKSSCIYLGASNDLEQADVKIAENACHGNNACRGLAMHGGVAIIGEGSCTGAGSDHQGMCRSGGSYASYFEVGQGSCKNGYAVCYDHQGEESKGLILSIVSTVIGDASCFGNQACNIFSKYSSVTIGKNSCLCEYCCSCLSDGDIVPDNKCHSLGSGVNNCCISSHKKNSNFDQSGHISFPNATTATVSPSSLPTLNPSSLPSTSPTSTSSSPPSMLIDTNKKYNIILEKSSFDSTQFMLTTEYTTSDLSTESQIEMSIMTFDCNATYGGIGLGKIVTDAEPVVSIKTTSLVGPLLSNTFQVEKFALKNSVLTSTGNNSDKSIAGELKFCVKAEIIIGAKSVNFRESNIVLDYDLSSNSFSITENDIKKKKIITSEESASNIYSIEACRCKKSSQECLSQIESRQTLNQDSLVNICLSPNSTDVKISELNMKFFHHELSEVFFASVTNSTGILGQSIISGSGSVSDPFQVTSRLISGLFDNGARKFDIKGTAYLRFHSSTRNLNLRSGDRVLQQEEADGESASYQMSVDIKRREMFESEYDLASFSTPVVAGFLVLVFSIAVIIYKKVS